jgi:gliding motility-associated lipoprotein GldB
MISRAIFSGLIFLSLLWSCHDDSSAEKDIAKIEVDVVVERFDKAYREAKPKDLPRLKSAYPFLFSNRIPDSIWVERLTDTLQDELLTEVEKSYPDLKVTTDEVEKLFQHLEYYDPTFTIPRVITLTNDVAYRDKVIVTDTIVLIALDNYLGNDHKFYQNIPKYISANMKAENIVVDIAEGFAQNYVFPKERRTFLEDMIFHGKLHYFKEVMLPFKSEHLRMGYSTDEIQWAKANESAIWSYFVEREMLYSTDSKLSNRFIADAPFSKFYLELDNESPGRLGQYMGWQIVKAYAERTGKDILDIMQTDPETLFLNSKYKPKK